MYTKYSKGRVKFNSYFGKDTPVADGLLKQRFVSLTFAGLHFNSSWILNLISKTSNNE